MKKYVKHKGSKIFGISYLNEESVILNNEYEHIEVSEDFNINYDDYFVLDGNIVKKSNFNLEVKNNIISNIPEGTKIVYKQYSFICYDSLIEIDTDEPTYIYFSKENYIDKAIFIEP